MRFAYIDSQGNEVTIPSVDALRLRIELKAIVEDTMFHDANSGKWAPAAEHEIFRTLQRELQELDAGGFDAATPSVDPMDAPPTPPPPGTGAMADEPDDDADDFGLGMTLDLAPEEEEDMQEPSAAPVGDDPSAGGDPSGDEEPGPGEAPSVLEGLDDLQLADEEPAGEEMSEPAREPLEPDTGEPFSDADANADADADAGAGMGESTAGPVDDAAADGPAAPPERFAMSPQDDLMGSVPDPGMEPDDDEDDDATEALQGLELEPTLADAWDPGPETPAPSSLDLEQPLSDYDADQPPAWMNEGLDTEEELLGGGGPAGTDDRDVPPPTDRGEPPARPSPRPRSAPPPRKLTRARTPGAGRLVMLVLLVAALGVGGWYAADAILPMLGGGGSEEEALNLPPLPDELVPQMRAFAASATEAMVTAVGGLPERAAIPERPDPAWLAGEYLAGAGSYASVPEYWQSVLDYLGAVEAAADPAFREALDREIADATLTEDNAALIRARAVAGWEAAARDRQLVFDQLRAVGTASLDLHEFLLANEAQIEYEPAAAGVSRDPVMEAVPATEAIGEAMWDRVAEITRALDTLGFLETVTTEGLLDTFLEKLDATPIR